MKTACVPRAFAMAAESRGAESKTLKEINAGAMESGVTPMGSLLRSELDSTNNHNVEVGINDTKLFI